MAEQSLTGRNRREGFLVSYYCINISSEKDKTSKADSKFFVLRDLEVFH